jgi:ABC-type anion transport system duplicated permease subunit
MEGLGRVLIVAGLVAVAIGVVLLLAPRVPWLGRLPGDLVFRRGPVTIYFPIATSLIVSVVLTILINVFWRR